MYFPIIDVLKENFIPSILDKTATMPSQISGETTTFQCPIMAVALSNKILSSVVTFPFIAKNSDYELSISYVSLVDLGPISNWNVYGKKTGGAEIRHTESEATYTNGKVYTGSLIYTITWA